MKKNKKEKDPNILLEKQHFYISEFEQEAAWLSFMHREGWKFSSTNGFRYRFEKTEKEDWVYELDYKENGIAEEDYLKMYEDFGWEYVGQYDHWCYFRKQRVEGEDVNTTLFGDRESKLQLCRRIINGQFARWFLPIILFSSTINLLIFTGVFKIVRENFGLIVKGLFVFSLSLLFVPLFVYLNQILRLNKLSKELEGTR